MQLRVLKGFAETTNQTSSFSMRYGMITARHVLKLFPCLLSMTGHVSIPAMPESCFSDKPVPLLPELPEPETSPLFAMIGYSEN